MKIVRLLTAVAGIASVLSAPAPDRALGAIGDPELILYRFPGVRDDGGGLNAGVATSVHCTNFSGTTETIRYVVRNLVSEVLANSTLLIPHLHSRTASTHLTALYVEQLDLQTGVMTLGTIAIAATSTSIICTAMTIDAASGASPIGIALRGIRFNPVPGRQE